MVQSEVARVDYSLVRLGQGCPSLCFAGGFGFLSGHKLFLTHIPSFLKAVKLLLVQPQL